MSKGISVLLSSILCAAGCVGSEMLHHEGPENPPKDPPPDGGRVDPVKDSGRDGDSSSPLSPEESGAPDAQPPRRPYKHFDINHVLITGQSNSVSNSGRPVITKTQPYTNIMFNTGTMPMMGNKSNPNGGCDGNGCTTFQAPTSFVPLVEGDGFFNSLDGVETISAAAANAASFAFLGKIAVDDPWIPKGRPHDVLTTLHGRSGNTYWCLRKGGCNYKQGYLAPFDQALMEVSSAKSLAATLGKSYVVRGVFVIHGESDHYSYTAGVQEFPLPSSDGKSILKDYADALIEWQKDYESSVKLITGQTEPIPLFVSQISGWNDARTSALANMQLDAHIRSDGKVILAGPSYALQMNQQDCLHYTALGEGQLGEMFARAYSQTIFEGVSWSPVYPKSAVRTGRTITIKFHVPTPPLVIDTQKVAFAANFGFESSAGPIQSVEIASPTEVKIVLTTEPVGKSRLSYAQNQPVPGCAATPNGARGNIRDSNSSASVKGFDQSNWSAHFDIEVP